MFGLAAAVAVYFAIGSREPERREVSVNRVDPTAVTESTEAALQRVRQTEEDFEVIADHTLNYEDGSAKLMGVRIRVKKRSGRDFLVTANEAGAGKGRGATAVERSCPGVEDPSACESTPVLSHRQRSW